MSDRLLRCRRLLAGLGLDAVLVSRPSDVRYLSGFRGDDTALLVGEEVALIVTDSRYWEQVREEVTGFELVEAVSGDLLADTLAAGRPRSSCRRPESRGAGTRPDGRHRRRACRQACRRSPLRRARSR